MMNYREQFERLAKIISDEYAGIPPEYRPEPDHTIDQYQHLLWMVENMKHYLEEKSLDKDFDKEKVNRWLGFIQGALWMDFLTSIKDERAAIREATDWCKC